jgi:hypothetical protein
VQSLTEPGRPDAVTERGRGQHDPVPGLGHRQRLTLTVAPLGDGDHRVPADPSGLRIDQSAGRRAQPQADGRIKINFGIHVVSGVGQGAAETIGVKVHGTPGLVGGRRSSLEMRLQGRTLTGNEHGRADAGRIGDKRSRHGAGRTEDLPNRFGSQGR